MTSADPAFWNRLQSETFVRTLKHLAEADSTNTVANQLTSALTDEELPALVIADRQTAGRGRGANQWWSTEGSLTFSVLIAPQAFGIAPSQWPALSLTTGAAIADALSTFATNGDVRLKWPNDVMVNGRKVCGILIEAPPQTPGRLILGIGINVDVPFDEAPEDVRLCAASVHEFTSSEVTREDILVRVLQRLDDTLVQLATGDVRLRNLWHRLCLLSGRSVVITDVGRTVSGTCLGIDDDGALRVQTGTSIERLFSGIVTDW